MQNFSVPAVLLVLLKETFQEESESQINLFHASRIPNTELISGAVITSRGEGYRVVKVTKHLHTWSV